MKKKFWIIIAICVAALLFGALALNFLIRTNQTHSQSIPIGILHSLTGPLAEIEKPIAEATLLAIEEWNARGGLLGYKLKPILIDAQSNFEEGAHDLIVKHKVPVIFGGWSIESYQMIKPICSRRETLLFYPGQHVSEDSNPWVVYTGACENQQLVPGVAWSLQNLGNRCFLIHSDSLFSHKANKAIKQLIHSLQGSVLGEIILDPKALDAVLAKIEESQPTLLITTLQGEQNRFFLDALQKPTPILNFSPHLEGFVPNHKKIYSCWNYYSSISSKQNQEFKEKFGKKYGRQKLITDPMEAAYIGVHLWAQAVQQAGSFLSPKVSGSIKGQAYLAPEGIVYVSPENNHLWKRIRIARLEENGKNEIVWDSLKPIRPDPHFSLEVQ